MMKGEVCKFYEIQGKGDNTLQQDCLANYDTNADFYISEVGFRYSSFVFALVLPIVCIFIEFFMN